MRLFRKPAAPTPPTTTSGADINTAYVWGMTLNQWNNLTPTDRSYCRNNITQAPRFGDTK